MCLGGIEIPDILTHLLIGLSLAAVVRGLQVDQRAVLIVFGALLPDIERPLTWLLMDTDLYWLALTKATHSLVGVMTLSLIAASFFESDSLDHLEMSALLAAGGVTHLLADMVLYPWEELGVYLLYPAKLPFSMNLVWSDFPWFPLFGAAVLLVCVVVSVAVRYLRDDQEQTQIAQSL